MAQMRFRGGVLLLLLLGVAAYALAEDLTLTTYYPSPRGVYKELRASGDVAIGTTSAPAARLQVVGDGFVTSVRVDDAGSGDVSPVLIDSSGNVAIGTTDPSGFKLRVEGGWLRVAGTGNSTGTDPAMRLGVYDTNNTGGITGWWVSQNQEGTFAIHQNGVGDRLNIDGAGNVGIGTTNPGTARLAVMGGNVGIGTTNPGPATLMIKHPLANAVSAPDNTILFVSGNFTPGVGPSLTAINATADHAIDAVGYNRGVYAQGVIGVYSYGGNWGTIGIAGNPPGDPMMQISGAAGIYGLAAGAGATGVKANGPAGGYDFDAAGPGVNYGSTSSIRWKQHLTPIANALDKVLALRGVAFDWDAAHGGRHDIGMVAEEVGKVFPEVVVYEPDGQFATGMDYGRLTTVLVEAVKAQQHQIEALRQELEQLKSTRH